MARSETVRTRLLPAERAEWEDTARRVANGDLSKTMRRAMKELRERTLAETPAADEPARPAFTPGIGLKKET